MMLRYSFAKVKLLTKSACSACQTGAFILRKVKNTHPSATYLICDIEGQQKYKEYINRVPVILVDEELVCEVKIDQGLIQNKLKEKGVKSMLE